MNVIYLLIAVMAPVVSEAALFNEVIPVSLVSAASNPGENRWSDVSVNLKISQRRLENNDKEIRFEISRADDLEFLYDQGITRQKFVGLAQEWHLNVDFDNFPKRIIHLLKVAHRPDPSRPSIQMKLTVNSDQTNCIFELIRDIELQTARIGIDLKLVRGEELVVHAMNMLRTMKKENGKLADTVASLKDEVERFKNTEISLKSSQEELQNKLNEADLVKKGLEDRVTELKTDLDVLNCEKCHIDGALEEAKEENRSLEDEFHKLEDDFFKLENDLKDAEGDLDALDAAKEELEKELDSARFRLTQVEEDLATEKRSHRKTRAHLLRTEDIVTKQIGYEMRRASIVERPSFDERKLAELEGDLKDKDEILIKIMEERDAALTRIHVLQQENKKLCTSVEEFNAKENRMKKAVEEFRQRQGFPPARPLAITNGTSPAVCGIPAYAGAYGGGSPAYTTPTGHFPYARHK